MATITFLRQRVIEDKTVRNLSPATRQSYIYAVTKFSCQFNRSPDQLSVAGAVCRLAKPRQWCTSAHSAGGPLPVRKRSLDNDVQASRFGQDSSNEK